MKTSNITIYLIIIVLFLLSGYIFFASTKTSLGYELLKNEKELTDLYELENEVILESANRQNPDYLYSAGKELGLIEIKTSSRYIDTRVSSISRVD